ncbi:DNA sulfur modification protein DndB [Bacillus altitudinis]|uniref:DNA sulfur modification protein DndB n=1 Tax=Bacillus altitudinis TaxID=293387 RepID=UPI002FFEDE75
MDVTFSYNFPAIRGIQAGKEYYVVMCPLRLIPKIFLFDEEEIPVEYRAQRILNKSRIPTLTQYIVDNLKDYVFSSITASIDGQIIFEPINNAFNSDLGMLRISMDSRFLINDGQHRRAAIEEALKLSSELGDETISVVFFHDDRLKRSQQIFSDLNLHSINTTSSIGILYDQRDPLALVTKEIVSQNLFLNKYTDKERVSLSKNSPKVLALNFIYNTNKRLLSKSKGSLLTEEEQVFLKDFWEVVCQSIYEWVLVYNKELSPKQLRLNYICGHSVFVEALGDVGNKYRSRFPGNWKVQLTKLKNIDWNRTNKIDWLGRAFNENGRIQKTNQTIKLTSERIDYLLQNVE